jgi:hypothetical protein
MFLLGVTVKFLRCGLARFFVSRTEKYMKTFVRELADSF